MKHGIASAILAGLICCAGRIGAAGTLEADFQNPPIAARPYVWWHWMGANFSKDGITKDLEAMKAAGIGGATIFNLSSAVQESQAPTLNNPWPDQTYRSPKYWEALRHAALEADRLGLEIGLHNTVGYSTTGGPWIDEPRSMQRLVWSSVNVTGGATVITNIAPPKLGKDDGWGATGRQINFYRDIAVLAVPAGSTNLAVNEVLDLTRNLSASGELNWSAPAGNWIVYRLGHSSTGRSPHPVPDDVIGKTLEADKLSLAQTKFHWETVINPLKEQLGPLFGKSFRHFLIDSYEAGNQNWTPNFRDEFKRRKGYDPLPWLVTFGATVQNGGKNPPVRTVGSAEQAARFEWDYRNIISTLYYENGWLPAVELIHAAGAKLQHEAYGGPFDTVEGSALADLPMTEFWTGRAGSANASVVAAARAAGKRIVGAEAFTGRPEVSKWTETPAFLKSAGDAQFASGVNRMILHHWVHQPFDDRYKPGMGMGWWGTHFSRNQTWFEPGKEFFRYLGRVQALLQRGEAPADFVSVGSQQGDGDVIPLRALKDVRVVDGKVLLPSGRKYDFISFPHNGAMLPEVLAQVKRLLADGATVVCSKPNKSPSLANFPECDEEVRSLATELWGDGKPDVRLVGRGRLFARGDVGVALRQLGIAPIAQVVAAGILPAVEPSFQPGGKNVGSETTVEKPNASEISSASSGGKMPPSTSGKMPDATQNIRIAAREDGATKIFFVANLNQKPAKFTASFRLAGMLPELWDAESGEVQVAPLWCEKNGRTEVDLSLGAAKSVFVVFRAKATTADKLVSIEATGSWTLSSDKQARAVISASTNVSGTAVFASGKRTAFELKPASAISVAGAWSVALAPAVGAKKQIELPALKSLSDFADAAVKYFSGTATYRTTVNVDVALLGAGKRVELDLGDVRDLVTVRVNGKNIGVLWHPPFACDITSALQPGANTLELAVVNTWHNRLVGDEQFPPDFEFGTDRGADKGRALKAYPEWFVKNRPRPETNRLAFVNWFYHRRETPLIRSGLLGPVRLIRRAQVVLNPSPSNSAAIRSLLPGGAGQWEFVWGDEFDGPDSELEVAWKSQNSGSSHILSSRWRENAVVTNGLLRLMNRKEKRGGSEWTSGNIWTRQMYQYGYFECRYRYGAAEGLNNSFWLMPTGTNKITKGKFFEIDINEGHYPNKVANNIHNHTDVKVVNGRKTHPSASRQFTFGTRPDVTIQLELPVTARKLRFSSSHGAHFHLGEFRIYNVNPAGYPDALSPTADMDKHGLVNFAREAGTKITTSGFYNPTNDTRKNLADGKLKTRWTSQREGDKWVEFEFAGPRTIGCVQFLNGLKEGDSWKGMVDNYRVAYHDGTKWVDVASFDIMEGEFNFARDFQVHGLDWNEKEMIFYLNGKEIRRVKNEFCFSPASVWLSEAIIPWAGRITDAIDGTAMEVDYVRIYRRKP